jgi:hypothetical protein
MDQMIKNLMGAATIGLVFVLAGCTHSKGGNAGHLQSYPAPVIEAGWIRNGDPIVYDGEKWFPVRDIENLTDPEVYQIGEYKGVQIFVDKIDIKPYQRIYTKFAKGKFRYFVREKND